MTIKLIAAQRSSTSTIASMNKLCLGIKAENLSDIKDMSALSSLPIKDFAVIEKQRSQGPLQVAFIRTTDNAEYATRSQQIIDAFCLFASQGTPITELALCPATGKNGDYLNLEDVISDETFKAAFTAN